MCRRVSLSIPCSHGAVASMAREAPHIPTMVAHPAYHVLSAQYRTLTRAAELGHAYTQRRTDDDRASDKAPLHPASFHRHSIADQIAERRDVPTQLCLSQKLHQHCFSISPIQLSLVHQYRNVSIPHFFHGTVVSLSHNNTPYYCTSTDQAAELRAIQHHSTFFGTPTNVTSVTFLPWYGSSATCTANQAAERDAIQHASAPQASLRPIKPPNVNLEGSFAILLA